MSSKVAAIVGVGPGLGRAVALRFAREGFAVALMARGDDKLAPVEDAIAKAGGRALSVPTDSTEEKSVADGFARIREALGEPEVLIYNAGAFHMGGIMETTPEVFETLWRTNCLGAFLAARQVVPSMTKNGRGTLLFTGATASLRGAAKFGGLAVGKFGLRALAQSLARELGPQGVHVAHVVIDGQIDTPRVHTMMPGRDPSTLLSPEAIAETYWQIHAQPSTAWTQEIDLRPSVEKF